MNEEYMELAIEESKANIKNDFQAGGPFGSVIVKNNKVIAKGHNTVIASKDPTAHGEINAIREACKILNTNDLTGCTLYTNAEPCPMCLSAIVWANIKEVYYANTKEEAGKIGFRDDIIYEYIKGNNKDLINLKRIKATNAIEVFNNFARNQNKTMY